MQKIAINQELVSKMYIQFLILFLFHAQNLRKNRIMSQNGYVSHEPSHINTANAKKRWSNNTCVLEKFSHFNGLTNTKP